MRISPQKEDHSALQLMGPVQRGFVAYGDPHGRQRSPEEDLHDLASLVIDGS